MGDFDEKNQFGFPKRDWLSFADAAAVLAAVDEQELRSRFAARRLGLEGLGLDVICRLVLAHEQEEQRQEQLQEELRLKEEERRRIAEEVPHSLDLQERASRCCPRPPVASVASVAS